MHRIFDTILILTPNEQNSRRDRQALRGFRPGSISSFASGKEALEFMGKRPVDLVLCDYALEDMDGVGFLSLLRQAPGLKDVPVVMVTVENRQDRVLSCISAGCTGYILRPYSMETFERHLRLAYKVETYSEIEEIQLEEARNMVSSGEFDDAIEAFEEVISEQDESRKYYEMGCHWLFRRKYGKAIIAFRKAVRINSLYAEAFKGLADAYKGKGDIGNYKKYLQEAANIHAEFDRLEEAKELFIEILKYEPHAPNPFNTLGVKLRKVGDYVGAQHAYRQALKITPEDEHIYFNTAKAYYFMGEMENAAENLAQALKLNPGFSEARKLYAKLTGKNWNVAPNPAGRREKRQGAGQEAMIDE